MSFLKKKTKKQFDIFLYYFQLNIGFKLFLNYCILFFFFKVYLFFLETVL